MNDYYLSIDAGTSGGKATILNEDGQINGFFKSNWSHLYRIPEDLEPYGHEFAPNQFWQIIISCIRKAISLAKIDPKEIKAISATSQRHGCVFLNNNGEELYAGPNRDARGLEVDTNDYMESEELYDITGHGLPFLFPLTRLLWFRENEEDKYRQIKHFVTIDGWVNYKLTGKYAIDDTSAAETLLYDITLRDWSEKILDVFEIPYSILPEKIEFGTVIESILPEVAQNLGLNSHTPVIMSCADTQASILGCGAIESGSLGVVAGSTMPLQLIIDYPVKDAEQKVWTGSYIDNLWVIESNAGSAGDVLQWFADSIIKKLEIENPYAKIEQLVLGQPAGARGVYADLGPQIFNAQNMLLVPSGGGFSFTPIAYSFDAPVEIGSLARALFENLAYAIKANTEQIKSIVNFSPKEVFLVGGLSRSKALPQILANVMNQEIQVFIPEGASVAGAIAGMVGTGKFKTPTEAINELIEQTIYYPQEDQTDEYESLYPQWKEIYGSSRELDE